ncbi:MAG: OmpA family protein [Desulfovibrionaceae bacterium]|jgi:outer membrane protein OmpA-like peptidoglycan-associated protein|nr:OmpA family protein [Desulfovibrionaceae bacterium]
MKTLLGCLACLCLLTACGANTVVLLPDRDGAVGSVVVTPRQGEPVVLDKAYQAVDKDFKTFTMSDAEITRTFGEALQASPRPTARFIFYFERDSTRLRPESQGLLPEVLQAFADRRSTDVSVTGHSDSPGDKEYNKALSLRRARAVADMLIAGGIPEAYIQVISHGEENPMIPTPEGRPEPRNRRVEVLVR